MPPFETSHEARHGAGVPEWENVGEAYPPRHGIDSDLIERIEDATGLNGETFLATLHREGLTVIRTSALI